MTTRQANGAAIKAIRERSGITQAQVAAACGFTPAMLSQIESGRRKAPGRTIHIIADQLGVPVDAISTPPRD